MSAHFPISSILNDLRQQRSDLINSMEQGWDDESVRKLAETHLAILAIEAVMAEPPAAKTGPVVRYDEEGWPV